MDEHSKAQRHHSGHFRHSQNKVWDPHPQYEFVAFGRRFHLSLREDSSFAPPGVTVTTHLAPVFALARALARSQPASITARDSSRRGII